MFISRIAFVALTAVFTFVQAIPSPAGKDALVARDTSADVTSILNDLKSKTDSILPQIDSLVAGGTASDENVQPLWDEITAALTSAHESLATVPVGGLATRQSVDAIAALIAAIVKGINGTLTSFPAAFTLISTITLLILNLLISLNALLPGLLVVVTGLLSGLVGTVLSLLLALLSILSL